MAVDTYVIDLKKSPIKPTILKDPNARLDYIWDWRPWLAACLDIVGSPTMEADVIDTFEVFAVGSPQPVNVSTVAIHDGIIVAFIEGGTVGFTHMVTCRIFTQGGRIEDRSIFLSIRER